MPEFHRAVGIPRTAAIEYPYGRLLGEVGDRQGQQQVLRAALEVFQKSRGPGEIHHLPFTWPENPKDTHWHPPQMSPIIKAYLHEIKTARRE